MMKILVDNVIRIIDGVNQPLIQKYCKNNLEIDNPQYKEQKIDAKFLVKCFKYLKKLGYIKTQYEFSEQFLGKNKYYYRNNVKNLDF